ncbi:hypothetical protein ACNF40_04765 [Cuniculiplasma sp. SKW4]|uniref:hypothetical protein n=1 Tax=Cuniculiplasma sp. SKW4 TaxID=3400171 RepID=UPI003FD11B6A
MNISKEFVLESYFPVPVLMDFFGNPELFFSSIVHLSVIRNTGKNSFEVAILPYTDEAKNISYYGTLEGPEKEFNIVRYKLKSINFGEHFEMNIDMEISRVEHSSRIKIKWDVMSESELWQVVTKSTASLNPEHMVKKHLEPFIREIEKISNKMNSDERFLFEKVKKEPMDSVSYITDKMEEIPSFVAIGKSGNSEFYAEVQEKKIKKIVFKNMAIKKDGGDAIISILNEKSQFEIELYFSNFLNSEFKR